MSVLNDSLFTMYRLRGRYVNLDKSSVQSPFLFKMMTLFLALIRSCGRRVGFFFYSLFLALAFIFLVPSGKYAAVRELHFNDLRDAMKKGL